MFRYSLIHGSRGYLNQAKHSSPSAAPGLTVHWPRIKLRWTLLLNLSLQATHSGLGSGVSWMFEENVYDGRVWLFDPLWCYVECVYIYEQLRLFTLMKRRCGVLQGLSKCWFHLQSEIITRWGDSKNEIGFDVYYLYIYEHVVVHVLGSRYHS